MPESTAIIPIKIDSDKRKQNVEITLKFLLEHTDFDIIVTEADVEQKFNNNIFNSDRIQYFFEKSSDFHRTRLINQMLHKVKTPVTVNYDADVFLRPESYIVAQHLILHKNYDLIYPYGFEQYDQRMIDIDANLDKFKTTLIISDIPISSIKIGFCRFGHVQFFKTKSYRDGFMENENYRHWCPEDEERGFRFKNLGYNVGWFKNIVFHQEHPPSSLNSPNNKDEIYELHSRLIRMNKEELIKYYENEEYLKKYK